MIRKMALLGAFALSSLFLGLASTANAQDGPCGGLHYGYQFGVGVGSSHLGHTRFLSPHDRPPHFALYPPVYYSDVLVRRPYGISPFAAPSGIRPVEMDYIVVPEPITIENPYVNQPQEVTPAPQAETTEVSHQSSTTQFIVNPFFVDQTFVANDR